MLSHIQKNNLKLCERSDLFILIANELVENRSVNNKNSIIKTSL